MTHAPDQPTGPPDPIQEIARLVVEHVEEGLTDADQAAA
jgi:hypothetical protein